MVRDPDFHTSLQVLFNMKKLDNLSWRMPYKAESSNSKVEDLSIYEI